MRVAFILKGYPRLSETFIAQEIAALERRGLNILIVSHLLRGGGVMRTRRGDGRILIYSHDTFGLGHLRRCRTIAHSLVERFKQLSVLILSGSPIIGSFDFRARVDFVRVPGVIKLRNGEYTPLNLHLDIERDAVDARLDHPAHRRDVRARTCSSSTRSRSACAARCTRR